MEMSKKAENLIRAFAMGGTQILCDLDEITKKHELELGHSLKPRKRRQLEEYDQFERAVRSAASEMSEYYEIFYCLENSIRNLISEIFNDEVGANWWVDDRIPAQIRNDVAARQSKEMDNGVSPRSDKEIDYTNFGELSVIIVSNWDIFEPVFTTKLAVQRVLSMLNLLRGPIAHCCPISDDEKARLEIAVKDWFRLIS